PTAARFASNGRADSPHLPVIGKQSSVIGLPFTDYRLPNPPILQTLYNPIATFGTAVGMIHQYPS
ncbi:MAG: hypothetical protein ACE5FD_19845, partial [Anaerolineae bacterium]